MIKIQKVITVIVAIMIIIKDKSFSNVNSDRSQDWSYVLLIQAFLNLAIWNHK